MLMSTMMMNDFQQETSQAAPEGTYTGAVDVLKKLLKSEGPVALYKGCVPILLRCDNHHDNDDDGDDDDHDNDDDDHDNGYFDYFFLGRDQNLLRFYDDYVRYEATLFSLDNVSQTCKNHFHL